MLLNLHEVFMLSAMTACKDRFCPPVWYMICIKLNHLLLVINSSVNIFIYCVMGDKFRYYRADDITVGQTSLISVFYVPCQCTLSVLVMKRTPNSLIFGPHHNRPLLKWGKASIEWVCVYR